MKRIVLAITILSLIVFASSAMAQNSSLENFAGVAPTSRLGSVVGKMVSVYSDTLAVDVVPAYPASVAVASTRVPTKYKSKTQWLVIHVTMQESCTSDGMGSALFIDGTPVYPADQGSIYYECNHNGGTETRTRTWFLPPENLGGRQVAPGATVEVRAQSNDGTARISLRSIVVQAIK